MARYLVSIHNEGHEGAKSLPIGEFETLAEAGAAVDALDARWQQWHGEQPVDPLVEHYEGCDVYAHDTRTGKVWTYEDGDVWEEMAVYPDPPNT